MRTYETMLVLDPEVPKEQIGAFIERLKQFLNDRGGRVIRVAEWGLHTLAYEIKKKKKGYYILMYFEAGSAVVADMERNLRLMEEVLRYLTLKREGVDVVAVEQQPLPIQEDAVQEGEQIDRDATEQGGEG